MGRILIADDHDALRRGLARGLTEAGHEVDEASNGNLAIEVESKHLAPPDRLSPPHSTYVVWVQPAGKPAEVIGQLRVNTDDMAASFKTSVPYHNFDIIVTAEDNAKPDSPSGTEVLRGSVQK